MLQILLLHVLEEVRTHRLGVLFLVGVGKKVGGWGGWGGMLGLGLVKEWVWLKLVRSRAGSYADMYVRLVIHTAE